MNIDWSNDVIYIAINTEYMLRNNGIKRITWATSTGNTLSNESENI